MTAVAVSYVVIAAALCLICVLALLGIGQLALSGSDALERDGLARGTAAPAWALPDLTGVIRRSPPAQPLQLIMFADHSLRSFPSVVDGLRALDRTGLEIVIMTRGAARDSQQALAQLGLADVVLVTGSAARYASYNIRVMPFAIFVDSAAKVRASSLVNHDWQLAKLRQVAELPLEPAALAPQPGLTSRHELAGT